GRPCRPVVASSGARPALRRAAAAGGRLSTGIAVGVSGAGSNLRALVAAANRGELGGAGRLGFADRCGPALDCAAAEGADTALRPGLASADPAVRAGADSALAETLR